jgi:AraC family transcriptional regulator
MDMLQTSAPSPSAPRRLLDTPSEHVWLEGEVEVPGAVAQLVGFHMEGPSDRIFCEDHYWLDLSLTPRLQNTRARYLERWRPHRYERVGLMMMVPAGHAVQFKTDGGSVSSIICRLQPALMLRWFGHEVRWTDRVLTAGLGIFNPQLRFLCLRLAEEVRRPGLASEALIELIASQIVIELARHCAAVEEPRATAGGLAAWRLRRIDERTADPGRPPALSELAELCRMSVRQLTRGFRESRGCSIGDWLERNRADHAKRLLRSDTSVEEAARILGYSSASNFSQAFRRSTGMSPRQFRQSLLDLPARRPH